MLIAALAVTVVGFILLVVALAISSVAFAWGCIGVCILGLVLLIVDVVRGRRGTREEDEESAGSEQGDETVDEDADEPGPEGSGRHGRSSDFAEDAGQ